MTLEVTHKLQNGRPAGNTGIFRKADGTTLVVVKDVVTKGIPISAATNAGNGEVEPAVVEESYYPVSLSNETAAGEMPGDRILVLADDLGRIDPLVAELRRGNGVVETITRGDAVSEDLAGLQAMIDEHLNAGGPVACIIFGFSLGQSGLDDTTDTRDLAAAAERDILALTALGQSLDRRRDPETPMAVVLLTHMARQVPGDEVVPVNGSCRRRSSASRAPSRRVRGLSVDADRPRRRGACQAWVHRPGHVRPEPRGRTGSARRQGAGAKARAAHAR